MAAVDKRKAIQAAIEYTRQRRFDKAIAEYQSALKADPQDLSIYKKLGDLYAQTGAVQEAIATYMKLGDLYRADNLAVKAIAIYKMVLNLDPRNMQIYLACADLYAEQGLMGEAKIQYMTVAEHYTRAGETGKALEVFEKIASLDPTNFGVAAKVGEMCEKEKLPAKAMANYVAAAQAAARAGHVKEARELFGRALRLKPDAFEPQFGLGKLHFDAGAYGEAAAALERAAVAAPGNPAPLVLLGQCHRRLGSLAPAQDALRRAVEADPTAAEARIELARCLLESGAADEAHGEFVAAADQFLEEGRQEEALALLQEQCAAAPQAAKPLAKVAEIHRRLGHEEEARKVQRRLATLYETRGEPAEAAAIYRQILEAVPDDPDCLARLSVLGEVGAAEGLKVAGGAHSGGAVAVSEGLPPEDEATPRVIPIAESVEGPGEEVAVLGEGEPGIGLFGGEAEQAAAGAEVMDDAGDVAEQLAEADVYLKYGLVEKAVERLRETLSDVPQNLAARARLRKLFLDEGRVPEAVAEGLALADALAGREQADRAVQELLALQRVDPQNREVQERLQRLRDGAHGLPEPSPPPPPRAAFEAAEAPAGTAGGTHGPAAPTAPEAPAFAGEVSPAPPTRPVAGDVEPWAGVAESPSEDSGATAGLGREGEEEGALDLSRLLHLSEQEGLEPSVVPDAEDALRLGLEEPPGEHPEPPLRLGLLEPAPEPEPALTLSLGGPEEELEEADFYRVQGMMAEAVTLYRRVLAQDPGNAAALAGLAALGSGSTVAEGPAGVAPSGEDVSLDARAGSAGPAGDTWIPGPGPFPLAPALELDLSPPSGPEAPGPADLDVDLAHLDLSPAEPSASLTAPPTMAATAPEPPGPPEAEPRGPGEPYAAPAPPLPAGPVDSLGLAPEAEAEAPVFRIPASAVPPAVQPPTPTTREAPPAAAAGPRRVGPAEEIPVFRVAAPTDARAAGGFVDLGAEIQKEMSVPAEGAALLDALLGEFQRGVRENLDVDDYETHYNLGIAYKEMDLFEEAIEEFRLAAKDPARRATCNGLMALCFLRKGQAEQAIAELTRALALPGLAPEEQHALRYDLATAYEEAGQEDRALEVLEGLVAQAPSFREAAGRVAALQDRLRPRAPKAEAPAPPARPAPVGPEMGAATKRPAQAPTAPPATPAPQPTRPRRDKISFV